MKRYMVLVAIAIICGTGYSSAIDDAYEGLLSSTNAWMSDFDEFNRITISNSTVLTHFRTDDSAAALQKWYATVLALPSPNTNSLDAYKKWLPCKARILGGCSRYIIANSNTNLYMETARQYRALRGEIQEFDIQREAEMRSCALDGVPFDARKWNYWSAFQGLRCVALGSLDLAVVERIGMQGLPMLPPDFRWSFYSNFVEQAQLPDNQRVQIEEAIQRAER